MVVGGEGARRGVGRADVGQGRAEAAATRSDTAGPGEEEPAAAPARSSPERPPNPGPRSVRLLAGGPAMAPAVGSRRGHLLWLTCMLCSAPARVAAGKALWGPSWAAKVAPGAPHRPPFLPLGVTLPWSCRRGASPGVPLPRWRILPLGSAGVGGGGGYLLGPGGEPGRAGDEGGGERCLSK